jgi:WD40 repeat protein
MPDRRWISVSLPRNSRMRHVCMLFLAICASATDITVVPQTGHHGTVLSLAFSPDGSLLVSGGGDAAVLTWDIAAGRQLHTVGGNPYEVSGLSWCGSGLIAATSDGTCLIDPRAGTMVAKAAFADGVNTNWAGSPDGRFALRAVRAADGVRQLSRHDLTAMDTPRWTIPIDDESPVIAPDGAAFVLRTFDGGLHLHDAATGARLRSLPSPGAGICMLQWSADGRLLAAAHKTGIRVWDPAAGTVLRDITTTCDDWLRLSPDGTSILASGADGKPGGMWHLADGHALAGTDLPAGCEIALNRDGTRLARCQGDEVVVFRLPDWTVQGRIAVPSARAPAWSPDGRLLAIASAYAVQLHDAQSLLPLRQMTGQALTAYTLDATPDGRRLYGAVAGGTWCWDLAAGEAVRTDLPIGRTTCVSADGRFIAGIDDQRAVTVHRLADGARIASYPIDRAIHGTIDAVVLSPDGSRLIVIGRAKRCTCWEVGKPTPVWDFATHLDSAAFTPDGGAVLAIASEFTDERPGELVEIDVNGAVLRRFATKDPRTVAVSPDGTLIAAPSNIIYQPLLRIWRRSDGALLHELRGHAWLTQRVAFSADGRQLVSADMDGTARLWDVASGNAGPVLRGHGFKVSGAVFLPGTRLVASYSEDATVRLWDRKDGHPVALSVPMPAGYVITLPNGVYKASRGSLDGVAMAVGTRAYPVEQFDLLLNRPDEVLSAVGLSDPLLVQACTAARAQRIARMGNGATTTADLGSLPEIHLPDDLPVATAERSFALRIHASHPSDPISRLHVFVDDVPLIASGGTAIGDGRQTVLDTVINVPLLPGVEKVQVAVSTATGARSLLATWTVNCTATPEPRTLHVVAIGVSDYQGTDYDLGYAAKDAADIAAAFAASPHGFAAVTSTVLSDAQATRAGILALRTRLAATRTQDEVVLFIAGHGVLDQRLEYRYASADFDFAHVSDGGLTFAEVEGLLDGIPARHRLLLMDTCHAGEVEDAGSSVAATPAATGVRTRGFRRMPGAAAGTRASAALVRSLFADLRRGAGAPVIASASGSEVAFESSTWSNGVFTMAVIEALRSAPTPLRVSDLRDLVSKRVGALTGGAQNPVSRRENLTDDFEVLGRHLP